ncbi:hypothetical protein IGI04_042435 [Brassica rapa subsp. trilocularis]|uniref:Uncharacterized protein n=1 Tax=Brassica rapa subsp. trilocularis TaxID=1813537 RepID=A0ABQ7KJD8_BRACM|nr:hypothetical protein IGI04_042435 [Brassica rapa subsp. trilocularis]
MCAEQTAHVCQKSPKQSTRRANVLSPRTNVLICVLMDSHGCPLCADRHRRTHTDSHGHPVPRGPKSPEQSTGRVIVLSPRTNVLICVLMDSHGRHVCADVHTRTHTTATDVLCVLTDTHGRHVCPDGHPRTFCVYRTDSPRGPKSSEKSTGRVSVLSPRTNVLICVLMDSHGRPVCADGHTRTQTDTHGQPQTSYSPRGPKLPEQSTGRASMLSPRTSLLICVLMAATDVLCVLTDTHGHTRTATDVLCVLTDSHGSPVSAEQTAHVGQNHPNSPREGPAC